jgi:hypothetical protein
LIRTAPPARRSPEGAGPPPSLRLRPGFNQRANSFQTNPNKTKQKSLDFLGFIRPNRGFSKGYEQENKKIGSRLRLCAKSLKALFIRFWPARLARRGSRQRLRKA